MTPIKETSYKGHTLKRLHKEETHQRDFVYWSSSKEISYTGNPLKRHHIKETH